MSIIISETTKRNIINRYVQKPISVYEISKIFSLSVPTIYKILKEYNVPIYKRHQIKNSELRESFFEKINTPLKAYFLGLIITDGCVFYPQHGVKKLFLQLKKQDIYIVERFKKELKTNNKIVIDKRDGSGQISISSNKMASDLKKYGIVPRKTFITYFPQIDKFLYPYIIRGIFDGDGCIVQRRNGRHVFCICGTYELLNEIKNILIKNLNIANTKISKEGNIFAIRWSAKSDILKIRDWIYQSGTDICIERKREIFYTIK